MSKCIYLYLDDLLCLQSGAADRHNHNGVLGAVREKFVAQLDIKSITITRKITNISFFIEVSLSSCENFHGVYCKVGKQKRKMNFSLRS